MKFPTNAANRVFLGLAVVLALCGVVGFPGGTPEVSAQSESIRVLHQIQQVNFPDGLSLGLVVESDAEISWVQLSYRLVGAKVTSYATGKFTPGKRINVRWDNLLAGPAYLPPGATVEYNFSVRDVAGNYLETPLRTLEYLDGRFHWEQVQARGLTLFYHDLPRPRVEEVAGQLSSDLARVEELLGLAATKPIRGFVYNSYREAVPAFPHRSRTITERQVFHGYAFPQSGVFLGVGLERSLIVHESAHLLLAQKLENAIEPAPAWLDEGLASYVEPGAHHSSGQSLSAYPLPLRAMNTVSGNPSRIGLFYLKAESVVGFLLEEYGVEDFQGFLDRVARGSGVEEALVETYGMDLDQLDERWSESGAADSRSPAGRFNPTTPFLLFNSWLLGGLFLLVMAVVGVRYVIRKLRPREEDDDSFPGDG